MRTLATVAFLVSAGLCAARTANSDAKNDQAKLQGEWQVVDGEKDGKTVTANDIKEMRMIVKGDEFTLGAGGGRQRHYKFKLDSSKSPKEIDILPLEGQEQGHTAASIYCFEGGQLKMCVPNSMEVKTRPKEFKTQAQDRLILLVLKRVKQP